MEYWTSWAITVVFSITDGETLATVLLYEVVFKYGTSGYLIMDNGSKAYVRFMMALGKALKKRLHYKRITRSIVRPSRKDESDPEDSANGLRRRRPSSWDNKLLFVTFVYNNLSKQVSRWPLKQCSGDKG
jgi:hypothetical protein